MEPNSSSKGFQPSEGHALYMNRGNTSNGSFMGNAYNEQVVEDVSSKRKRKRPKEGMNPHGNGKHAKEDKPWSDAIHRALAEAIYDIGVKNASPAVIMEQMSTTDKSITSERVKSHLQKYRNNKEKSKQEFFAEFDTWMQKALTVGAANGMDSSSLAPPSTIVNMMGSDSFLGGEMASFLSYSAMYEDHNELNGYTDNSISQNIGDYFSTIASTGAAIPFPVLTEEERKTPLGVSISHVVGLFYSIGKCIMQQRVAQDELYDPAETSLETNNEHEGGSRVASLPMGGLLPHEE